jgi:multidrug efflux system outer membrane protein
MKQLACILWIAAAAPASAQTGPDYTRPATETADRYKSAGFMREAQPLDGVPRGAWWRVFADRRLDAVMEDASRNSQQLKGAIARFDQARAAARIARANFFPTLGVGAFAEHQRTSENMPAPFPLDGLRYNGPGYSVAMDFAWELDLWGRIRRESEAAGAELAGTAAAMHSILLTVQADVAANYFRLRTLDQELAIVRKAVELRRESREITAARVKAGAGSELELAQSETEVAVAEAEISSLQIQRNQLENAIAILAGQNPASFRLPAVDADLGTPPSIPGGVPSDLLERRPDIAQAERTLAAASARIGAAKAAAFPSIRLLANGGPLTGEFDLLTDPASLMWNAGPRVSVPILTGGKIRANWERNLAAHDEALAAYRQVILTAFGEVENSLTALQHLGTQAQAQARARDSAAKALQLARTRYEAGTSPYLDVIEADRTAVAVERGYVQIAGQRFLASVALVKALGGGWDSAEPVIIPDTTPDPAAQLETTETERKKGFLRGVFSRSGRE